MGSDRAGFALRCIPQLTENLRTIQVLVSPGAHHGSVNITYRQHWRQMGFK